MLDAANTIAGVIRGWLLGSSVYMWRSAKFYEHLGRAVYSNYLVAVECAKNEPMKEKPIEHE